jgi:large subunit ribosomal protein L35
MPKMKSHRGAAKRFRVTKSGKVKAAHAMRRHLLVHKAAKRRADLRRAKYLSPMDQKRVERLLPYR